MKKKLATISDVAENVRKNLDSSDILTLYL